MTWVIWIVKFSKIYVFYLFFCKGIYIAENTFSCRMLQVEEYWKKLWFIFGLCCLTRRPPGWDKRENKPLGKTQNQRIKENLPAIVVMAMEMEKGVGWGGGTSWKIQLVHPCQYIDSLCKYEESELLHFMITKTWCNDIFNYPSWVINEGYWNWYFVT